MALDPARRDTIIGAGVVVVGAVVLAVVYGSTGRSSQPGYDLIAAFNKAEGISVGSDVRLAGVSIGKVVRQSLDDRFRAILTLRVAPGLQVPDDSSAAIHTDGLLGAKYITLQAGGDDTNLKPGEEIRYTQDSVNLQDLLQLIIAQGEARRAAQGKAPPSPEVPHGQEPH